MATEQELKQLRAEFSEGIPLWMQNKSVNEIRRLMQLRRKAFPNTKRYK